MSSCVIISSLGKTAVVSNAKCDSVGFSAACTTEPPHAPAYRQLDLDERRTIFRLLNAKVPVADIAQELGRHRSTIHREISRNHFHEQREYAGYFPLTAQECARQRRQRLSKLRRHEVLRHYIIDKLERCWSPEQIAGRLRLDRESGVPSVTRRSIATSMVLKVVPPAFTVICRKPADSGGHATAASRAHPSSRLPAPSRSGRPRSRIARLLATGRPIC